MKTLWRMPSPSVVISTMALFVAASGTAVAASRLINGDQLIRTHSLSGNRLRNHTITGTQINKNELGKVPSAAYADYATSADSASTADTATSATSATNATNATNAANAANAANATNATNATNAGNANTLGGRPPDSFESASNFTRKAMVGTNEGSSVTFATFGPFTLTLTCVNSGGNPQAEVFAASSQANSEAHGQALPTAGVQSGNPILSSGASGSSTFAESGGSAVDFATPTATWIGDLDVGVNYAGNAHQCFGFGVIVRT